MVPPNYLGELANFIGERDKQRIAVNERIDLRLKNKWLDLSWTRLWSLFCECDLTGECGRRGK